MPPTTPPTTPPSAATYASTLGAFLRSRRERLTPEAAGLPNGARATARRRRTPGLRREEVAERAGIGVDWYVRLEQGRSVRPSAATVEALARALRLGAADRAHLLALARPPRPDDGVRDAPAPGRRPFVRERVPAAIRRLVEGLGQPAYVTGRRWDVLAWNAAAADVLTDFGRSAAADRNLLVYMLITPGARELFGAGWADEARRMVAQFRATYDLWAGDPAFDALLARLDGGCPEFGAWWAAHDVRGAAAGRKVLHHPTRGPLHFEYTTFQANDDPALRLAVYTAVSGAGAPSG